MNHPYHVEVMTHNGALFAADWLFENMPTSNDRWSINNTCFNTYLLAQEPGIDLFQILCDVINVNNIEMRKTHPVKFSFKNEDDAVWFKAVWG